MSRLRTISTPFFVISPLCLLRLTVVVCAVFAWRTDAAIAQRGAASVVSASEAFRRVLPDSVTTVVTIENVDEADALVREARLWRVLRWTGAVPEEMASVRSIKGWLARELRLDREEVAVLDGAAAAIARSGADLGVLLVRFPRDGVTARLFAGEGRLERALRGGVRVLRLASGRRVAVFGRLLVLGTDEASTPLVNRVASLVANRGQGGLATRVSPLFASVPDDGVVQLYIDKRGRADASLGVWRQLVPAEQAGLTVRRRGDSIDVLVQGTLGESRAERSAPDAFALEDVMVLPRTTALALSLADVPGSPIDFGGDLPVALAPLLGAFGAGAGTDGRRFVAVWDQPMGEVGSIPAMAIMVRGIDEGGWSSRVDGALHAIAPALVGSVLSTDAADASPAPARFEVSTHLSAAITTARVELPGGRGEEVGFSWTIWRGWLIAATTREHIERIVEARLGLVPRVASIANARSALSFGSSPSALAFMQPSVISDVFSAWAVDLKSGETTLLSRMLERGASPDVDPDDDRLGIGMRVTPEPGAVVVARVYPGGAADGRLHEGDRILALNGELLGLTGANAHLRRLWRDRPEGGPSSFRVLRADSLVDVAFPPPTPRKEAAPLDPANALLALAAIGRGIPMATLVTKETGDEVFAARLSIQVRRSRD